MFRTPAIRIRRIAFLLFLTAAVSAAAAAPARAQSQGRPGGQVLFVPAESRGHWLDVSAGYTVIRDSERAQTLPLAWITGLAFHVRPSIAIAGEADGAYNSVETPEGKREYRTHAFMAGVRTFLPRTASNRVFVQALAGTSCYCGSTAQPDGRFSRGLAVQVGAGIDVPVATGLAVRFQGDLRHVDGDGLGFSQFRLAAGAVVGVPRR